MIPLYNFYKRWRIKIISNNNQFNRDCLNRTEKAEID